MTPVQQLHAPVRTEAEVTADRIRQRLVAHIGTMIKAGALEHEIAAELVAKIDATCRAP